MNPPMSRWIFDWGYEHLSRIAISYRVASTKINSGHDEICLEGTGEIKAMTRPSADQPMLEKNGRVAPFLVGALLEILRAEGFEQWDAEYASEHRDYVAKVITVTLDDAPWKEVVLGQPEFPEFAHVVGAYKMLVATAIPDVMHGRFFQRI